MAAGVSDNATTHNAPPPSSMAPYFKIRFSFKPRLECHSLAEGQHNMTNVYDGGGTPAKNRDCFFSEMRKPFNDVP